MTFLNESTIDPSIEQGDLNTKTILPLDAMQDWILDLHELDSPFYDYSHAFPLQTLICVEGSLKVKGKNKKKILLRKGEHLQLNPNENYWLTPINTARFFTLSFLQDPHFTSNLKPIAPEFYKTKEKYKGYHVYTFWEAESIQKDWSVALIELLDAPKHFHQIEAETFIVASGKLNIESMGDHQILNPGEGIIVPADTVHKPQSATGKPIQVLCISVPAFNAANMYLVD